MNTDNDEDSSCSTKLSQVEMLSPLADEVTFLHKSWFEETMNKDAVYYNAEKDELQKPNIKIEQFKDEPNDSNDIDSTSNKNIEFLPVKLPKCEPESECKREIEIEFIDSSNDVKFERLMKDEKIKTPFKRRLSANSAYSSDSRSNSPQQNSSKLYSNQGRRGNGAKRKYYEQETSIEILARRQKQIDYGKNTIGYDCYTRAVPPNQRTRDHPWTPPKNNKYSRRAWDGLVKLWRKKLHVWDPSNIDDTDDDDDDDEITDEKPAINE